MGCSSSRINPKPSRSTDNVENNSDVSSVKQTNENVLPKDDNKTDVFQKKKIPDIDRNANTILVKEQFPVPKSVAFDVTLDGESGGNLLLFKRRPPNLLTLEPLNFPRLTAEQLADKMRMAEEKREKMKQKKIKSSQRSSKRRRELLQAREFGLKQQLEVENVKAETRDNMAQLNRERKLMEIKEKQKLREERARRARERAKSIQAGSEDVEVENDVEFNAGSDDSWLGSQEEEEYGLKKKVGQVRPVVSASTVDSYDAAFMRKGSDTKELFDPDFFGS
ncbi:uncharacterized protein LOC131941241 [Physella acuta]|uniref:uncharacterized protein LOC131941241 n=1 Tax=Physella acuta TaxID=109671 RepID=UPI0027DD3B2F|nr:uncharacterized protein LOC131941241 [Physella acuta]